MMTFEQAHATIKELILNFQNNENHYLSPTYSEAEVRQEYIDPFFTALGWDVGSKINKNPHEREVVIEKTQSQEDSFSKKRADYAFYIAPNFKKEVFFVEAKKTSRTLRLNKEDYFQTAKYGYNSGTGISILFDFEEFVMIDCRFKPDKDTVLATQIKYYKYTDFLEEEAFSEIYFLFSRMAVAEGKLQNYISNLPTPKKVSKSRQLKLNIAGQLTIDQDFLNFVEEARVNIAQAIYNNHPQLKNYELTEAVQKILDRFVFIRFLEDKSIEPEYIIQKIFTSTYPWNKFVEESKRLEAKYNSIVFKKAFFDKDDFLDKNNTYFNETIIDFLASESPYNFNYIPIEIIGNIYERFLGKTIEIEDNKVKIDLKPAVRKAGGVFYTPSYIVDYIIQNTIGKQIENKTPKEVSKLTFADISCGSGSFLIGIFDHLIQYHQNYYFKHPAEAEKEGCLYDEESATWKLSLHQKKQILLNNVYGVDIDHQATEVAQMSLLLKLLEHENLFTTSKQQSLFVADKILPTLSENIKSGNSLIGKDVVFQGKMKFDNYEEELKINPFDFEPAFPKVFKNGGFDAIVGNPPYYKITDKQQLDYFETKYKYQNYQKDLYLLFLERFKDLIKNKGLMGVIIPNTWLQSITFRNIRVFLVTNYNWKKILHIAEHIFDAVVDTHVLIFEKSKIDAKNITVIEKYEKGIFSHYQQIEQNNIPKNGDVINILASEAEFHLFEKINKSSNILSNLSSIFNGVKPFEKGKGVPKQTDEIMKLKPYVIENQDKPNNGNWLPLMRGSLMNRYLNTWKDSWILYGNNLAAPRDSKIFEVDEKIIIRQTGDRIIATIIGKDIICRDNLHILISKSVSHFFILGVINSKLIDFYYYQMNPERGEVLAQVKKMHVEQLPIPKNYTKDQEQKMITLVEQMLESKKREKEATSDREKEYIADHIKSLDYQIDNLVYEMYGFSDEERVVLEGEK
jgi:hypothetical protein